MKNILVTGYTAQDLGIHSEKHKALRFIQKACNRKISALIQEGAEWFISPGQYGFDLWAIEIAMKLRDTQYPHVKVSIIHAYENQTEHWNENKQQYWTKLRHKLDYFDVVSKQKYDGPWQLQARDQLLLQKTNGMLLFYDSEAAESKVKYIAKKAEDRSTNSEYRITYITADDIQQIIEEEQEEETFNMREEF